MTTARAVVGVLAVVLALTVSSCNSIDGEDRKPAAATSARASAASAPPTSAPPTPQPSLGVTPEPGADLGAPVAVRQAGKDGFRARIEVFPLVRSGRTVLANVRLTATGSTRGTDDVPLWIWFSDGNNKSVDFGNDAADGVQLIDGRNAKVHLPASDGKGTCLCPTSLFPDRLAVGHSMVFSFAYTAPPEDVASMDLVAPTFGTIARVPIR